MLFTNNLIRFEKSNIDEFSPDKACILRIQITNEN